MLHKAEWSNVIAIRYRCKAKTHRSKKEEVMGQQQTVTGNALRRMIMLVAVVALMAAMLAVNAMPAFAKGPPPNVNKAYYHACNPPGTAPSWCE